MKKAPDTAATQTTTSSAPDPCNSIASTLRSARARIYRAAYRMIERATGGDLNKLVNLAMGLSFVTGMAVMAALLQGGAQ